MPDVTCPGPSISPRTNGSGLSVSPSDRKIQAVRNADTGFYSIQLSSERSNIRDLRERTQASLAIGQCHRQALRQSLLVTIDRAWAMIGGLRRTAYIVLNRSVDLDFQQSVDVESYNECQTPCSMRAMSQRAMSRPPGHDVPCPRPHVSEVTRHVRPSP